MRRLLIIFIAIGFSLACTAEDRPVLSDQLPAAAKTFINTNFPGVEISYATVDDDIVKPDYEVVLSNGAKIQFSNDGALEKVECRAGVPDSVVPVQIREYVTLLYPGAVIVEYDITKRRYEIGLSNGLELKFNSKFKVIELDD